MRYTRRGRLALWPLIFFYQIVVFSAHPSLQQSDNDNNSERMVENAASEDERQPLPTGKWNQFKGFFTPRPLPANSHFTFASVWAGWSAWSNCENGIRQRVRACNTIRGFSCLGPNRDIIPCERTAAPTPPKRHRQLQAPTAFSDVEDPWAEDREEAFRQLYHKQEEPHPIDEEFEQIKVRGRDDNGIGGRNVQLLSPDRQQQQEIGPPSARPELFASKLLTMKQKNNNKNIDKQQRMKSIEEMEVGDVVQRMELKQPLDLMEKLAEFSKQDTQIGRGKTVKMMERTAAVVDTTTTTKTTTTAKSIISRGTTTPLPPTTTITSSSASRSVSPTIHVLHANVQKTVDDDTVNALEWMMANMTKSVESVQQKSREEQQLKTLLPLLHSGESVIDPSATSAAESSPVHSANDEQKTGNSRAKKPRQRQNGEAIKKTILPTANSFFRVNSESGENRSKMQNRERQRVILELSKAQLAKKRQIEKSREQIQLAAEAGGEGEDSSGIERQEQELTRLRKELQAMEAVLARMRVNGRRNNGASTQRSSSMRMGNKSSSRSDSMQRSAESSTENRDRDTMQPQNKQPVIVFPMKKNNDNPIAPQKQPRNREKIIQRQPHEMGIVRLIKHLESSDDQTAIKSNQSVAVTPTIPATTTITATTTEKTLILTEQPNSIWLNGQPQLGNAEWSIWGEWSECICGRQMRSRHCNILDDNTFNSRGCTGKSYESRQCIENADSCPTTVPPLPPSKKGEIGSGPIQRHNEEQSKLAGSRPSKLRRISIAQLANDN